MESPDLGVALTLRLEGEGSGASLGLVCPPFGSVPVCGVGAGRLSAMGVDAGHALGTCPLPPAPVNRMWSRPCHLSQPGHQCRGHRTRLPRLLHSYCLHQLREKQSQGKGVSGSPCT